MQTHVIIERTTIGEPTPTSVSTTLPGPGNDASSRLSVGDAVMVTFFVTFAVTFVLAFSLGVLVHAVVVKQCRGRSKSASGATPSGPVYEVVDSREENTRAQQKFELKENVAYGPVGM